SSFRGNFLANIIFYCHFNILFYIFPDLAAMYRSGYASNSNLVEETSALLIYDISSLMIVIYPLPSIARRNMTSGRSKGPLPMFTAVLVDDSSAGEAEK
ncbi:hypothetical protein L9F63_024578, partial [Diploptera punctata]